MINIKKFILRVFYIFGAVIIFIILAGSYFQVDTGSIGLVKRFGEVQNNIYEPGFNFKNPFLDRVVMMDVRNRKVEADASSASKDLQSVSTIIALNYSINKDKIISLYSTVGNNDNIENVLIKPALQESIKASTSQYNASDLITKRELVKKEIEDNLRGKTESLGIKINQLNIVNFDFSEQFNQIVEQKVTAEQQALAEKNKLETVKYQAQQSIEQAKAEAEKIKIQAEAITKQGGAEYVQLQWINKWDGKLPSTMLGSDSNMIYNIK
ncbi:prohibitin family protein [Candidatus Gracilibacteria bacterium]|nr:prohibitin family protein [Candidatus Gracilibacteria bacterium]NUJ99173.1 prohibitin family protein [Candidatus Gracilibacteria bacterium]